MNPIFNNANAYEAYVGRWSRLAAHGFIRWLNIPTGQNWLDVGAGTGILTEVILQEASPAKVVGVDLSQDYIAFARQRIQDDRVEFRVEDAGSITFDPSPFDVAVAGLVLNFVPSPEQAARSMAQAVKGGGTVAAYVWDYSGQMEMMRQFWDAAIIVDPAARKMDAGQQFPITKPDNLRALFESVGLQAVDVIPIDIQTRFSDFEDYWLPFLGAQGSVSKYLHTLTDQTRAALRDQLQRQLPIAIDGSISLVARAWAVKGQTD
jgi:ubiquinone/menaquinone biosynthesis C-methylase UbiE